MVVLPLLSTCAVHCFVSWTSGEKVFDDYQERRMLTCKSGDLIEVTAGT